MSQVRGRFVTLEGVDGSGKTTTARLLAGALKRRGIDAEVIIKQEPPQVHSYGVQQLTKLAELLWTDSKKAPISVLGDPHWIHLNASYFAALDHMAITPALEAGRHVVIDSWYHKFATRASMNPNAQHELLSKVFGSLRTPDIAVFLDPSVEAIAARKPHFTTGETGMDASGGDPATVFVDYQSQVRDRLLDSVRGIPSLHVVRPNGQAAEQVADTVSELLTPVLAG